MFIKLDLNLYSFSDCVFECDKMESTMKFILNTTCDCN